MLNKFLEKALDGLSCSFSYLTNDEENKPSIYVTYFNLTDENKFYAYNESKAKNSSAQIDIWVNKGIDYEPVQQEIKTKLEALGFWLKDGPELYNSETKIIHKVLTCYKNFDKEED